MTAATQAPATGVAASGARGVGRLASGLALLLAAMALVAVFVGALAGVRVRVEQTGSMAPSLNPGDLVLLRQTPLREIQAGEIVGVRNEAGKVIVHRVVRVEPIGGSLTVTTKGDANPTPERWSLPPEGNVALVLGRIPGAGQPVQALSGPVGVFVLLLAAMTLALFTLRAIWSRD